MLGVSYLFDKNLTYFSWPNKEEMESIFNVVTTEKTRKIIKVINVMINIIIPMFLCLLTKCNLIVLAFSFVLVDVILNFIEYHIAVIRPHKRLQDGVLSYARSEFDEKQSQIEDLINKMGVYIDNRSNGTIHDYHKWEDDVEDLKSFMKYEKDWMEKKLIPFKEEEIKTMQKPAKDYSSKQQYFLAFEERLSHYISNCDLVCLRVVHQSIKNLIKTLSEREIGYELIPTMFYVYIDELQKVIDKIKVLDNEQRKEHISNLIKVADAFSKNVDRLVFKIQNEQSEEIDIGLSVLLKELTEGGDII